MDKWRPPLDCPMRAYYRLHSASLSPNSTFQTAGLGLSKRQGEFCYRRTEESYASPPQRDFQIPTGDRLKIISHPSLAMIHCE
jgi:hypothetical protein